MGPPPIPSQTIAYASIHPREPLSRPPGRSGALITLAVFCFVVATGSMLSSAVTAAFWITSYYNSPPAAAAPAPAPLPRNAPPPVTGEIVGAQGLPAILRKPLVDRLPVANHPFGDDIRFMYDQLLSDRGQLMLRGGKIDVRLDDESNARHRNSEVFGRVFYKFGSDQGGFIQISPRRVDFYGNVKSVLIEGLKTSDGTSAAWTSLAQQQTLDDFVALGITLTPRQQAAVLQILSTNPRQGSVDARHLTPVQNASVDANGMLTFTAVDNTLWHVLADGRHVPASQAPRGIDSASGTIVPTPLVHRPQLAGSRGLMLALGLHMVVSLVFGILLVAAGVLLLARPAVGVPMLRTWCAGKFLLAAIELALSVWFLQTLARDTVSTPLIPLDHDAAIVGTWQSLAAQLALPVAAMLTLAYASSVRLDIARHASPRDVRGTGAGFDPRGGWIIVAGALAVVGLIQFWSIVVSDWPVRHASVGVALIAFSTAAASLGVAFRRAEVRQ